MSGVRSNRLRGARIIATHVNDRSCTTLVTRASRTTSLIRRMLTTVRVFAYTRDHFEQLVDDALAHRASRSAPPMRQPRSAEGCGLSVSVRQGEVENVEHNRDKAIGVTVYIGQRRGNASTSDFSRARSRRRCEAALRHRALHRADDPAPASPTPSSLGDAAAATSTCSIRGTSTASSASSSRSACEAAALRHRPAHHQLRRRRRVGAAVAFFYAATRAASAAAIRARATRSRCALDRRARATTCSATTGTPRCARPRELAAPEAVGRYAAERALVAPERAQDRHRATCRCCSSRRWPPACSAPSCRPSSGGALYRKSSFLLDTLGKQVFAPHRRHPRRPAPAARQGQRAVRRRRRATAPRDVVEDGVRARLLPRQLFGAQARHADHRQRGRLAQPDRCSRPRERRPRRRAAQARHAACS